MTREAGRRLGLGPLGGRLFAAFAVVALSSVALLTAAALVGTDRGISTAQQADRQRVAERTAAAAAAAYHRAGGWSAADLGPTRTIAAGADAVLTVQDADSRVILSTADSPDDTEHGTGMHGQGHGTGMSGAGSGRTASADIVSGGSTVGSVHLRFPYVSGSAGRNIAWGWIAGAALAALALALAVSWYVTRRLTDPVVRVARTARALAAGDHTARARVDAPGELGDLSRAFDTMADDVTHAEQARRRLSADVAHELRTPLAALQAGLEELRDGYDTPSPARLAALHDQTLRLGRVVGDLAELSEAESARLSLNTAPVELAHLVRHAVTDRESELRAAGLTVRTRIATDPLPVHADADRIHQALGNLLSNAARYCRPGDTVTVTASAEGDAILVEVTDDGPGIPADELPHVFDRLWRGSAARHRSGGSGIGLAVVKELITAHGGTVTALSEPAAGTRIVIRLPRDGAARPSGDRLTHH
ncbi:HAMP domain-containing histidine kinase [Streptomyces sp. NBC_01478]|uniref:sensor histidine kinase n=1 Tax=Streptomyces sp. NBC_01478 TaxID=2903882 RepID=UPI002E336E8B|nr:HAMP domain-containing sensor histidine kinase [Streptomyces sp. NBC_01478]